MRNQTSNLTNITLICRYKMNLELSDLPRKLASMLNKTLTRFAE